MTLRIGCVVEGHGEAQALPVLLRRLAALLEPELAVELPKPNRIPRNKLVKPGELERAVDLAARNINAVGAVLVLFDADDDCPAVLAPPLVERARRARADIPVSVVLANREFESWFLAAAASLSGCRGLPPTLAAPPDPEVVRGAKEWLSHQMASSYSPVLDQPALAQVMDVEAAASAPSFDKFRREVARLIATAPRA
jgi:hypothetical protein